MKTNSCPEPWHQAHLRRAVRLHAQPAAAHAARTAASPNTALQRVGSFGDSSHSPRAIVTRPALQGSQAQPSRDLQTGSGTNHNRRALARRAPLAAGGLLISQKRLSGIQRLEHFWLEMKKL